MVKSSGDFRLPVSHYDTNYDRDTGSAILDGAGIAIKDSALERAVGFKPIKFTMKEGASFNVTVGLKFSLTQRLCGGAEDISV